MIAAVCAWHEHHSRAADEITRRLRAGEPMFIAAPAVVEAYAVLTRLPSPHHLAPDAALRIIETSFVESGRMVTLDGHAYRSLVHRLAEDQIIGGRSYDAVIAECALLERGVTLLTFNERDFSIFARRGLAIVVPGR